MSGEQTPNSAQPTIDCRALTRQPFRLFFLAAALFAAAAMPAWALVLRGMMLPVTIPLVLWHGHEMLFGFTIAVVAGFLLTASENWTGRRPADAPVLIVLLLIWLAARLAPFLAGGWAIPAAATLDIVFLLSLMGLLARVLLPSRNYRNLGFAAVLLVFALLDLWFFTGAAHGDSPAASHALFSTVDLTAVLMALVGGRVIPFFTQRRLPQLSVRRNRLGDWTAVPATILAFLVGLIAPAHVAGAVFIFAGIANLIRMRTWGSLGTLGEPLLAVLHVGYFWLGAGLLLRGLGLLGVLSPFMALHALTAGAIGTLTLGMMTRVTRGHTGRALSAGKAMTLAFVAISLAALLRLAAETRWAGGIASFSFSGTLWAGCFVLWLIVHLPALLGPRKA